jgi:hypothetical protein
MHFQTFDKEFQAAASAFATVEGRRTEFVRILTECATESAHTGLAATLLSRTFSEILLTEPSYVSTSPTRINLLGEYSNPKTEQASSLAITRTERVPNITILTHPVVRLDESLTHERFLDIVHSIRVAIDRLFINLLNQVAVPRTYESFAEVVRPLGEPNLNRRDFGCILGGREIDSSLVSKLPFGCDLFLELDNRATDQLLPERALMVLLKTGSHLGQIRLIGPSPLIPKGLTKYLSPFSEVSEGEDPHMPEPHFRLLLTASLSIAVRKSAEVISFMQKELT